MLENLTDIERVIILYDVSCRKFQVSYNNLTSSHQHLIISTVLFSLEPTVVQSLKSISFRDISYRDTDNFCHNTREQRCKKQLSFIFST